MSTENDAVVSEGAEVGPKNGAPAPKVESRADAKADAKLDPAQRAQLETARANQEVVRAQTEALAEASAQKFVDTVLSKEKPVPADEATAALLARAQISEADAMLEVLAARLSEATGIPMRVGNMAERLARARSEGKITNEKLLEVLASSVPREVFEMMAKQVVPASPEAVAVAPAAAAPAAAAASAAAVPASAPTMAPVQGSTRAEVPVASGGFFQRRPAAGAPAGAPAGGPSPALTRAAARQAPSAVVTADPLIEFARMLNRTRRKPQMYFDPDHRVALSLEYRGVIREDEDVLIPERGSVVVVGRLPEGVDFDLSDLRVLQLHPYGLDRLLVGGVAIDDVPILGQGPAMPLGRWDGAPSGTVTRKSEVALRLRNVSSSVLVFAVSMMVSPYREVDDGSASGATGHGG